MSKDKIKTTQSKFKVGQRVRTLVDKEPYYSNYGGNPRVLLPAGSIGIVGAVNVPPVTASGSVEPPDFNCVDFHLPGVYQGGPQHRNDVWRAALLDSELEAAEFETIVLSEGDSIVLVESRIREMTRPELERALLDIVSHLGFSDDEEAGGEVFSEDPVSGSDFIDSCNYTLYHCMGIELP